MSGDPPRGAASARLARSGSRSSFRETRRRTCWWHSASRSTARRIWVTSWPVCRRMMATLGRNRYSYSTIASVRAPSSSPMPIRCSIAYRARRSSGVLPCVARSSSKNSEESQLVAAFTADGGYSWTPVEMAMKYTGPLILNAGIVETEIKGEQALSPSCPSQHAAEGPTGIARPLHPQ